MAKRASPTTLPSRSTSRSTSLSKRGPTSWIEARRSLPIRNSLRPGSGRSGKAPAQRLARQPRDNRAAGSGDLLGHQALRPLQPYPALIQRQPIEARPVFGGEGFQPVKRALFVEHGRIALQGMWRAEDAGAAASRFLGRDLVRRGIGPEEELGAARRRRLAQGQP